jgi:hypothetical protein
VGRRFFWAARDPGVVEVTQAGVVRAVAVGTTEVAASVEGQSAVARVTVVGRPIATVQLEPAAIQLVVGQRQRLAARTLNDAGAPAPAPVAWSSVTPGIVSVSADGEVTAVAPGAGSVRATSGDATATAVIVVTPVPVASVAIAPSAPDIAVGTTTQLTATLRDAGGGTLAGREVSWNSRDPGIAVVSSSGQVTGIAPGTATVVARADGQSATATVTVRAVPSPASASPPTPAASASAAPSSSARWSPTRPATRSSDAPSPGRRATRASPGSTATGSSPACPPARPPSRPPART